MNNSFKDKESVIVNGFGKNNNYSYKNKLAIIICRDPYFKDYNVKFENGITRRVDNLGRIVIPKEMRDILGWNEGDKILIVIYKDVMLLRKANYNCQMCQGDKKLFEISGKWICKKCAKQITRISIKEVFSKKELEELINSKVIDI